ncbi:ABC transporter substrate-binding protein [Knoellia sp. p5-6-4]|uniref:ABC transporter substrate-binding protein n=1 Tax=unclassified Knoellia TaxID=2618719 RepID=UPI0023DA38AC|nr:extracellular solute-binding protein [Knoellia sp. p5-6-4]MDF2144553.1 extracellular solute-binding protein [Knoellia sp. p5-6-4]
MRSRPTTLLAAAGLIGAVALAACTPGSDSDSGQSAAPTGQVTTDPAKLGDVTLTVWDQEIRGGQKAQIEELNQQFQQKYPNIKLKRVSRSTDDLNTTLKLALSGNEPPDVFQANNGRPQMGSFVQAGQLLPLDRYADAYGWKDRYPESVRKYSSYSPDGKTFGTGSLYGLPQVGEVVGIFVNKAKLEKAGVSMPQTWDEFTKSLATLKGKGELPLVLGNLDKWPAIHVFGTVQAQNVQPDAIRTLGFGQKGGSWKSPENTKAAQTLVDWVDKGYFSKDVNGQGYDPAWQAFSKGTGAYLIAGTWLQADLGKAMGDDVTFVLPPSASGSPAATGGTGIPWAVSSKSKHPDAAAAYINFITSPDAMGVLAKNDNLPIADTAEQEAPNALAKDVFGAFGTAVEKDALVPYLDYATPTMADTIGAALQDLLAKKATPEQFLDTLEKDYSGFVSSNQ